MSDLFALADSHFDDEIDIKINVQSPGAIELIGYIPAIIMIAVALVGIIGGRVKFFGIEFDTPGIVGRLLEWQKLKQQGQTQEGVNEPTDEQKERLIMNAENLEIQLPGQLQKSLQAYVESLSKQTSLPVEAKDEKKEE